MPDAPDVEAPVFEVDVGISLHLGDGLGDGLPEGATDRHFVRHSTWMPTRPQVTSP